MTSESKASKFNEIVLEELEPIVQISKIFSLNISRALRLLKKSVDMEIFIEGEKEYLEYVYDVTRATIVFLHTSLETTIREIIRLKLKFNGDFSTIPLAGNHDFPNRKERFSLGELAQHRGKSINEVIEESIDQHLSNISFNSTKEIAKYLEKNGFPQETLQKNYTDLSEMIERRHRIVHEGDLKKSGFSPKLESIDMGKVVKWFDGTSEFCSELIRIASTTIYLDKIMERLKREGIEATREDVVKSIKVKVENKYPSN